MYDDEDDHPKSPWEVSRILKSLHKTDVASEWVQHGDRWFRDHPITGKNYAEVARAMRGWLLYTKAGTEEAPDPEQAKVLADKRLRSLGVILLDRPGKDEPLGIVNDPINIYDPKFGDDRECGECGHNSRAPLRLGGQLHPGVQVLPVRGVHGSGPRGVRVARVEVPMAAHGLTIMRQIQKLISEGKSKDDVTRYVDGGLSAPGTCFTVGFSASSWGAVERVNTRVKEGEASLDDLALVVDGAIKAHAWMDAYPCMEAINDAAGAFVRYGKPHWKKRSAAFDAGDEATHAAARAMVAARWPLERRAPTFG